MSGYGHDEAVRDLKAASGLISRALEYVFSVNNDEMPDTEDYPRDEQIFIKGAAVSRLMLASECVRSALLPLTTKEKQ